MTEIPMLERVAKALYEAENGDEYLFGAEGYLKMARAALEAMKEPTEGMTDAAREIERRRSITEIVPPPYEHWRAMLDAAIEGK